MKPADEFQQLSPLIYYWQAFDAAVKADLSSCAVTVEGGLLLVDPIPMDPIALGELTAKASPRAIVLTNGNHERAARQYQKQFGIPIYASKEASKEAHADLWVEEDEWILGALRVIALPGFGPGEIALYYQEGRAALMGDAIINQGSMVFALLPEKYCSDQKQGRNSLQKLREFNFEIMTFAHGEPVIKGAKERLEQIL